MTPAEHSPAGADTSVASPESDENGVPSGNLFTAPKLTALDPADKKERKDVDRLLESLDAAE